MARRQANSAAWVPGGDVGGPGVHRGLYGVVAVFDGVDPVVCLIPGHRRGDVSVAQLAQGGAFFGVVLAAVLHQVVHRVGVAGDEGLQGAARADRAQLAVIADEHQFRSGRLGVGGQADQVDVVGHARPRRRGRRCGRRGAAGRGRAARSGWPRFADSPRSASRPRFWAAWPEVAVPITW